MLFTLYLNKLPFRPDFKQIIYVGGDKDDKVTQLVVRVMATPSAIYLM